MPIDELRPIPGYEDSHSISPRGRVFAHARVTGHNDGRVQSRRSKWLKSSRNKYTGYHTVELYDLSMRGRGRPFYVHFLVMLVWGPPRPSEQHQPNHKDFNRSNNDVLNLEWATALENTQHSLTHGRLSPPPVLRGAANPNTKLNESAVLIIRQRLADGESLNTLARAYGVSQYTIYAIRKRLTRKYI